MRRFLPISVIGFLLVSPGSARGQVAHLELDSTKIDAVFKDFGPTTPGCALGIYQRGKVVYAKGYGMADLNLGVPITPRTVFDIGSTSKQFAAASMILLANDGKVSLSDDVRKYIPELPDYGHVITIDHMLRHISGLRDYNGLLYLQGFHFEDYTDDEDALKVIVQQRALNFDPGTQWDYSNTGFFLLSVIIKRVSGKTLAEFAKERLFTPLGMTITHFRDDHTAILKNRATAYDPAGKGKFSIDMSDWDQTGDGAVNTNVLEFARWDENFYTAKVGGHALIDKLQQRGTLNNGDSLDYARGLFIDKYRGLRNVQHGGAWAGYRAMLSRFPAKGTAIGLTCNVSDADTDGRTKRVADVILAKEFTEPVPLADRPKAQRPAGLKIDPADFVGLYFSAANQGSLEVAREGDSLVIKTLGISLPLIPIAADKFTTSQFPIELSFASDHRSATLSLGGRSQGSFERVPRLEPSADELAALAGEYRSPELLTTWTIRIDSGKAVLKTHSMPQANLVAIIKDGYQAANGFLTFRRDASGRINGFDYSASRMKGIRFER